MTLFAAQQKTVVMSDLVLVAEDEADIQELLEYNLRQEGFQTFSVKRGDQVIDSIKEKKPSLVLLDLMMPGMLGIDVCKQIRNDKEMMQLPLIIITARTGESDKVVGLELGADDYITKPFSPKEVMARVKALLRRSKQNFSGEKEVIEYGPVKLDVSGHKIFSSDKEIFLTFTEFKLLRELMSHVGKVLARHQLTDSIMGSDVTVTERAIDVHMTSLRKKLGVNSELIETVRGVGYRFRA